MQSRNEHGSMIHIFYFMYSNSLNCFFFKKSDSKISCISRGLLRGNEINSILKIIPRNTSTVKFFVKAYYLLTYAEFQCERFLDISYIDISVQLFGLLCRLHDLIYYLFVIYYYHIVIRIELMNYLASCMLSFTFYY